MNKNILQSSKAPKLQSSKASFTIVELLIVIVVIGVLAAISMVAYTGIQTRAENTKTRDAVSQAVKAVSAYKAINGIYPGSGFSCLADVGVQCSVLSGGSCFGFGGVIGNQEIVDQLSSVVSGFPKASTQKIDCGGGVQVAGAFYYNTNAAANANFVYYLKGADQKCDSFGGKILKESRAAEVTQCRIVLN